MQKLHRLRKHLVSAVPALARDPDRLLTFVDEGSVEFHRGPNLSHEYRFTAEIILLSHNRSIDTVMVPLLQWLAEYQPDVKPDSAVTFRAEIHKHDDVDLIFSLDLTERVIAKVDCAAGSIHVEHALPHFPSNACPATRWQLSTREPGQQEWTSPASGTRPIANDLQALEDWVAPLLAKLEAKERRRLARTVATALRRSQRERIRAQRNPDSTAYTPRQPQKWRAKQGSIRRKAMFSKLATAKWLKATTQGDSAVVAFFATSPASPRPTSMGYATTSSATASPSTTHNVNCSALPRPTAC